MAPRAIAACIITLFAALIDAAPAAAQYFGRNKVQYKNLDFQVLKTEHFDIYYYPSAREGIDLAARMAERWRARLQRVLDHELSGRQPLILYASHADFEQTNVIQGELGEGTGGVTEGLRRRIVLPLGGPLADTDHVIGHELVHAFQFDITTAPGMGPGQNGAQRLPLWFIEGMAEYLSLGAVDPHTAMWMRDAARREELPEIDDLDSPKYFPYRWGQAFWAYVAGRWGDGVITTMLATGAAEGGAGVAIERVLGVDAKTLSADWHSAIRSAYAPTLASASMPDQVGTLTISEKQLGGSLNVGPVISPDGRWIAYLSERNGFSIDLFVADLARNRVARRLTSTATDPHYTSLQFIYSAGAWDSESRRLAIATVTSGRPALAVFDVADGRREREIRIMGADEIFNPTWSPDGRSIAVTAMNRGVTDLVIVDLETSAVRQLTTDAYADLQPAWSPDGRRIAFATDRFRSNLEVLEIGGYDLALIDPATGRVERVPGPAAMHNLNPQWSGDSRSLYFISDSTGIPNVFRVELDRGSPAQLTDIATGVTGITAMSPALSVATATGVAAFSVFDDGRYEIYTRTLDGAAPVPQAARQPAATAAALPPLDRRPSEVQQMLADARDGLPERQRYESTPYRGGLQLEALGQPTIAIGADRFGGAIGGGISASFSDLLGNHSLVAGVQMSTGFSEDFTLKNTAAQAAYINQSHRWNWGLVGGQTPYFSGTIQQSVGTVNGEPSLIDQTFLFRQTEQSVGAFVAYPFNRAHRVEFQAGATRISFDQIVQTQVYSLNTGALFIDSTEERSLANTVTLGNTSAALVYDTSTFGATSPVQGQRYRLEAAPSFGTINMTSVLADYRKYVMPIPFYTIALRGFHYARYGSGGEDTRLFPLSIGYPTLVRGYDVNAVSVDECEPDATSDCPAFDRLIGSRMLVGNLEFRFPLLRPFTGSSGRFYGPVPVEVAFFVDGGVAWNQGQKPSFLGGRREGIVSTGLTLRANLFGFAIGQFDFARPLQRPGKGWVFQFNLAPGF